MVVAMLLISFVDALAKYLSASYSPLFIGWARYAVASSVVLPVAALRGPRVFPEERRASHAMRTMFLIGAMTLYFLALARLPLATAASASLIGPIVAVVLSVALLGERMTAGRTVGLLLGMTGAIVIVQPGASTNPAVLLALGCGLLFGCYLIATRHAALGSAPVPTLAFQCAVGTLLLTPLAMAFWDIPATRDLIAFAALGTVSAVGHLLSIVAFRFAAASTLAPLVYVELIGAAGFGYLMFDEIPGWPTVIGAACIVASGFVLLRESNA